MWISYISWEEALAKFNRISVVKQESTVCKIARKKFLKRKNY